ncbi:MAG TPA: lipoyl(octanoyl) transferase LipB, partial [Chloroflexota bacterium]|nr:lipoyl(octanoyl) transferase LipB [Chloroflexota bacterium]
LGKDVHRHVWRIEETLIRTLADFGVEGHREPAYTGVWVDNAKIAAIGVRVARWVSSHGFALNVSTDLSYFDAIIPCGIAGRGVTSLSQLLRRTVGRAEVEDVLLRHFADVFEVEVGQVAGRHTLQARNPAAMASVSE